ncbi:hypothetical protein E2C01_088666 [Portunus trituberculatus]|uniref:Uncharacterized protein n=1 Tax=Portunus trituberculatus TaxID=210409 RepID=A0A5B7JGM9_PORTR|nr:hypothetical protein [Portunus trituberculatus]
MWFPAVTVAAMAEGTQTGRNGRPYSSGEKAMALRVPDFFRNEVFTTKTETELEIIASKATGVSVRSLARFKKEMKEGDLHSPPKRNRGSPVLDSVDSFDEACIRRIILAFYENPYFKKHLDKNKGSPSKFLGFPNITL